MLSSREFKPNAKESIEKVGKLSNLT